MNGAQVDIKPRESVKDKDKAPDSGIRQCWLAVPELLSICRDRSVP